MLTFATRKFKSINSAMFHWLAQAIQQFISNFARSQGSNMTKQRTVHKLKSRHLDCMAETCFCFFFFFLTGK